MKYFVTFVRIEIINKIYMKLNYLYEIKFD